MTRRAAYLLAWGVAYSVLGLFIITTGATAIWGVLFGLAGVLAIIGAVTVSDLLDTIGFVALTASASIRGVVSLFYVINDGIIVELFAFILWLAVGVAQFIVSGWKDPGIAVEYVKLPEPPQGELSDIN